MSRFRPYLRRGFVDLGSSLNILPLTTLVMVGNARKHVVEQAVEVFGFGGNALFTLAIFQCRFGSVAHPSSYSFHVIDARTSYHLMCKRLWIHKHRAVPSTYHQCFKAIWRGEKGGAYISEAALVEDGE